MNTIPKGYCQCGCGQQTAISTFSRASSGRVKGEPLRYIKGHIGGINAAKKYDAQFISKDDGTVWKACTKCGVQKEISQFSLRKGKCHSWCKECNRVAARALFKKNPEPYRKRAAVQRNHVRNYLKSVSDDIKVANGCKLCGEKELCILDFHHVEKGEPVTRVLSKGYGAFEREVKKCVVLCCNCHRKVHARILTVTPADRITNLKVERLGKAELEKYGEVQRKGNNTSATDLYS